MTAILACVPDARWIETDHEGVLICLVDKPKVLEEYLGLYDEGILIHGSGFFVEAECREDCGSCRFRFRFLSSAVPISPWNTLP
jgi:hypothetical protein